MTINPYPIALKLIPGLGDKSIRQLMTICKDPETLFDMSHAQLKELFPRHTSVVSAIESRTTLAQVEKEIPRLEKHAIQPIFFTDEDYPQRLNREECGDCPTLLYKMGSCTLNADRAVAMVGSRKCTDYGRQNTYRLVEEMASDKPIIVSGLAYGIDTAAHTAAVENDVPTVAVLGHGFDTIYPSQNRPLAKKILDQGGALLTEYPLDTPINPAYFPARNRIVAALADATVVAESAERGGALITANIASSYNREVFAIPGRIGDTFSEGCNNLIVNNRAIMIRNAGDIYFQMGWKGVITNRRQRATQKSLFAELTPNEQTVLEVLRTHKEMEMLEIEANCNLSLPQIAAILSDLELKKVVYCLPGRLYKPTE